MSRPAAILSLVSLMLLLRAALISAQPTAPATPPTPPPSTVPTTTTPAKAATASVTSSPTTPQIPPATIASTTPASAPTTTIATTAATTMTTGATTAAAQDLATPKATVRALAIAMQSGDKTGILAILHADSPTETRLAQVMAELAEAMARLSRSAVAAFGEDGARPVTGEPTEATEALDRLDAATVHEEGDSATIGTGPDDPVVNLVRVDGKWKLPVAAIIAGADDAAVSQRLLDVQAQVSLFEELAAEVQQGKFKTGEEVRQALDQRILQLVMARPRPATAPIAPPTPRP